MKTIFLRSLLGITILVAIWGLAVLVALCLYNAELLPLRWQRSIHTGVRMSRAEWNSMDETGKHLPRPRRTRRGAAPTPTPTPEAEQTQQ